MNGIVKKIKENRIKSFLDLMQKHFGSADNVDIDGLHKYVREQFVDKVVLYALKKN